MLFYEIPLEGGIWSKVIIGWYFAWDSISSYPLTHSVKCYVFFLYNTDTFFNCPLQYLAEERQKSTVLVSELRESLLLQSGRGCGLSSFWDIFRLSSQPWKSCPELLYSQPRISFIQAVRLTPMILVIQTHLTGTSMSTFTPKVRMSAYVDISYLLFTPAFESEPYSNTALYQSACACA